MAHRVMFYVFIRISYMIIFTCQNSETVRICRFHQLAEVFRRYSNVCHLLLCTKKKKKKKAFPGSSDGKESTCSAGDPGFDSWVRKIPWRRDWQPTPVFLPGESLGQSSLTGYRTWVRKVSGMTE